MQPKTQPPAARSSEGFWKNRAPERRDARTADARSRSSTTPRTISPTRVPFSTTVSRSTTSATTHSSAMVAHCIDTPPASADLAGREHRGRVVVGPPAPQQEHDAELQDEDADRGDQETGRAAAAQRAVHDPFQQQADRRGDAPHDEQRGPADRPVPHPDALPHDVGAEDGDRAEGDVEDAGHPEGREQPDGGKGGDAADRQSVQREFGVDHGAVPGSGARGGLGRLRGLRGLNGPSGLRGFGEPGSIGGPGRTGGLSGLRGVRDLSDSGAPR